MPSSTAQSFFVNLQAALKDVFGVTVQKEEELNQSTAALALACLLQQYSHAPLFATQSQRLASFGTPLTGASPARPSPLELASAGFFHTGRGDEAVCGTCFLGLRDWQPSDIDAEAVHRRFTGAAPCLYLSTRRLLTSILPLARKGLLQAGGDTPDRCGTIVERLAFVARDMTSTSGCWPVQNARALGYTDDVIVLALWRLQDETSPPTLSIDPQATTDLLKAILRVQESGLEDEDLRVTEETSTVTASTETSEEEAEDEEEESELESADPETESPTEEVELEGLGRQLANLSAPQRPPCLAGLIRWWADTWLPSQQPQHQQQPLSVPPCVKVTLTSA